MTRNNEIISQGNWRLNVITDEKKGGGIMSEEWPHLVISDKHSTNVMLFFVVDMFRLSVPQYLLIFQK